MFGRKLDPQPPSEVAVAPGVEHVHDEHDHHHRTITATATITPHDHDHDHPRSHGTIGHGSPAKILVSLICPGMVLLSFIFSVGAVLQLSRHAERMHQVIQFTWLAGLPFHMAERPPGHLHRRLGLSARPAQLRHDPGGHRHRLPHSRLLRRLHGPRSGYYRFFGYMNLFVFFMLMLVLANNYALLFVGWEGVGLCSYLLIGFYFHKKSAGDAGKKAFIVNRMGDAGFILGMLLMFSVLGTVRFVDVNQPCAAASFHAETAGFGVAERDRAAAVHRRHR